MGYIVVGATKKKGKTLYETFKKGGKAISFDTMREAEIIKNYARKNFNKMKRTGVRLKIIKV